MFVPEWISIFFQIKYPMTSKCVGRIHPYFATDFFANNITMSHSKVIVKQNVSADSLIFLQTESEQPLDNDVMLYILQDNGEYKPIGVCDEIIMSSNKDKISNSLHTFGTFAELKNKIYEGPPANMVSDVSVPELIYAKQRDSPLSVSSRVSPLLNVSELVTANERVVNKRTRPASRTNEKRRKTLNSRYAKKTKSNKGRKRFSRRGILRRTSRRRNSPLTYDSSSTALQ